MILKELRGGRKLYKTSDLKWFTAKPPDRANTHLVTTDLVDRHADNARNYERWYLLFRHTLMTLLLLLALALLFLVTAIFL
jgi:hypothetical protein